MHRRSAAPAMLAAAAADSPARCRARRRYLLPLVTAVTL